MLVIKHHHSRRNSEQRSYHKTTDKENRATVQTNTMIGYLVLFQLLVSIQARQNEEFFQEVPEENDKSLNEGDFLEEYLEENDAHLNRGFSLRRFREDQLRLHNYYRKLHGVPRMRMDRRLTAQAQKYAEVLASRDRGLRHCTKRIRCDRYKAGENLARAWGGVTSETNATKAWYDEIWAYNFCDIVNGRNVNRPGYKGKAIGHFTQVVWKTSTKLGIGYARTRDRTGVYVVARYLKHGNFKGRYKENVLKPDYIFEFFNNDCKKRNGRLSRWSRPKCSRSCGGGIPIRTRTCSNPKPSLNGRDCRGKTKTVASYEWCNTKGCPGKQSYRDLQCEAAGKSGKAKEYGGWNQCKLYCAESYVGDVEDGTHCNSYNGACVEGNCKRMPTYINPNLIDASGKIRGKYTKRPSSDIFSNIILTIPYGAIDVKVKNKNYKRVKILVGYKLDSGGMRYNWGEPQRMSSRYLPYTKRVNINGVSMTYTRTARKSKLVFNDVRRRGFSIILFAKGSARADISWKYTPPTTA